MGYRAAFTPGCRRFQVSLIVLVAERRAGTLDFTCLRPALHPATMWSSSGLPLCCWDKSLALFVSDAEIEPFSMVAVGSN